MQGDLGQDSGVIVVGTIDLEAATKSRRDVHLAVVESGPIVRDAIPGLSVRFHMVRTGETWLADDLEEYVDEAILLLES